MSQAANALPSFVNFMLKLAWIPACAGMTMWGACVELL